MNARSVWLCAGTLAVILVLAACSGKAEPAPSPTATVPPATNTPAPTPTPSQLTPEQIVTKMKDSVVNIEATYPDGVGGGTGIVWGDATHIVTNAHVVGGAGAIKVVEPSTGKTVSAKVVALSTCDDVALLSVPSGNFVPATLGNEESINAGQAVVALGYPATFTDAAGLKLSVTQGIVSKLGESYNGREDLIQTDAPINHGSSGGPLVDAQGNVIGMNTLSSATGQNINYAIAIGQVKKVADQLTSGKNIDYIGVNLTENYPGLADDLGILLAYTDGLLVTGIDAGSPAEQGGLVFSDLIYSIDDVPVSTVGDVCDILRSRGSGATLNVDFVRTYTDGTNDEFITDVVMP